MVNHFTLKSVAMYKMFLSGVSGHQDKDSIKDFSVNMKQDVNLKEIALWNFNSKY